MTKYKLVSLEADKTKLQWKERLGLDGLAEALKRTTVIIVLEEVKDEDVKK